MYNPTWTFTDKALHLINLLPRIELGELILPRELEARACCLSDIYDRRGLITQEMYNLFYSEGYIVLVGDLVDQQVAVQEAENILKGGRR
jgi:hypothetical protein